MSNHTPGPWRTDGWTIIAGNAINIAYTRTAIAEREEEQQANARLIAAAPALLAACEFALAIAEGRTQGTWDDVMLEMRRVLP